MKEEWERMEQPFTLNLRQINEMIQSAFPGKQVIKADRIGTGLSNSNYKIVVEGSSQPFVIRLYREGGDIAEKELALNRLVGATVPVADFLYFDTSCQAYERPWAVLEWKEGILLSDVMRNGASQAIPSAAASAGKVLADIHGHAVAESGFFNKDLKIIQPFSMDGDRFLTFIEDSLFRQPCGKWLSEELVQAVWSYACNYGPLLSESRETPVLVHSDYNGLNILMTQERADWSVSAVLDWECAFAWSRYADIGNMLRYEQEGSLFEQHLIRAYQEQGGVLEENWKLLSKLEDLVALCDMLGQSTVGTPKRRLDLERLIAGTVRF